MNYNQSSGSLILNVFAELKRKVKEHLPTLPPGVQKRIKKLKIGKDSK